MHRTVILPPFSLSLPLLPPASIRELLLILLTPHNCQAENRIPGGCAAIHSSFPFFSFLALSIFDVRFDSPHLIL